MRTSGIVVLVVTVLLLGALWLRSLGREPRARVGLAVTRETGTEVPAALLEDPGFPREASARAAASARVREESRREEAPVAPTARDSDSEDDGAPWLDLRILAMEDKRPLANVHVEAIDEHGSLSLSSSRARLLSGPGGSRCFCPWTDADGRVALELRAGFESTLLVQCKGNVHARSERLEVPALAAGEHLGLEVELETQDDLRWFGRVLDDATGAPLAGALAGWRRGDQPLSAVSGADGVLALDFASWGETRVEIELAGYRTARLLLERGHESLEGALPVRLARPAALEVRVRDGAGAPLARIPVDVVRLEPPGSDGARGSLVPQAFDGRRSTDRQGVCTFESLPVRETLAVTVRPGLGRSQREVVTLTPGETRTLAFEVANGCTLQGLAVNVRGEPLATLDLWRLAASQASGYLDSRSESAVVAKARTDARGRFVFRDVPAGEWWIGPAPYHSSLGIVPVATRVSIPVGESVHEATIVCRSPRFIRGRVLTPDGERVQARVTASREGVSLSAQSGGDGRFSVGPLPDGDWSLQARAFRSGAAPSEVVRAASGSEEVLLRLRAGGRVRGTVLDARGTPVPGAEVALVPEELDTRETRVSGEDGAFAFDETPPGVYLVWAKSGASAGVLGPLALAPRQTLTRLELVLTLGADLRVRLATDAPTQLEVCVLTRDVPLAGAALAPGAEWIETLPPGPARVQLVRRTNAQELEVVEEKRLELSVGQTALLEFAGPVESRPGAR